MERVLASKALDDIASEFVDFVLRNTSENIHSELPLFNWHSMWDERDRSADGTVELSKELKVLSYIIFHRLVITETLLHLFKVLFLLESLGFLRFCVGCVVP